MKNETIKRYPNKIITKNFIIRKISNPNNCENKIDGLAPGGDRFNSYTWAMAETKKYIYIGSNRNLLFNSMKLFISNENLASLIAKIIFKGDVPTDSDDNAARIFRYNKCTKKIELVYKSETDDDGVVFETGYRSAITFKASNECTESVYLGGFGPKYARILKFKDNFVIGLDKPEVVFFDESGFASIRSIESYNNKLYFGMMIVDSDLVIMESEAPSKDNWNIVANLNSFQNIPNVDQLSTGFGGIFDLISYNGYLYATIGSGSKSLDESGFLVFKGKPIEDTDKAKYETENKIEVNFENKDFPENKVETKFENEDSPENKAETKFEAKNEDVFDSCHDYNYNYSYNNDYSNENDYAWNWEMIVGPGAKYETGFGIPYHVIVTPFKYTAYDDKEYVYAGTFSNIIYSIQRISKFDYSYLYESFKKPTTLYRFDENDNWELVIGTPNDSQVFKTALGNYKAGFVTKYSDKDYSSNQYIWRMSNYNGKLFLGTFDSSTLYDYLVPKKIPHSLNSLNEILKFLLDYLLQLKIITSSAADSIIEIFENYTSYSDANNYNNYSNNDADYINYLNNHNNYNYNNYNHTDNYYNNYNNINNNDYINIDNNCNGYRYTNDKISLVYACSHYSEMKPSEYLEEHINNLSINYNLSLLNYLKSFLPDDLSTEITELISDVNFVNCGNFLNRNVLSSLDSISKKLSYDSINDDDKYLELIYENLSEYFSAGTVDSIKKCIDKYNSNKDKLLSLLSKIDIYLKSDEIAKQIYYIREIRKMLNNSKFGFDFLVSEDGINFTRITRDGFNNKFNYGLRTFISSKDGLYIGTANPFYGGQLWKLTEI